MCYNIRAKYNIYGVSYNEEKDYRFYKGKLHD